MASNLCPNFNTRHTAGAEVNSKTFAAKTVHGWTRAIFARILSSVA